MGSSITKEFYIVRERNTRIKKKKKKAAARSTDTLAYGQSTHQLETRLIASHILETSDIKLGQYQHNIDNESFSLLHPERTPARNLSCNKPSQTITPRRFPFPLCSNLKSCMPGRSNRVTGGRPNLAYRHQICGREETGKIER